jgi:hypothetical protein
MPNPNRRAGTAWEEDAARDARTVGGFREAERAVVKHPDRGDIRGVPGWTLECKSPGPHVSHTPEAEWRKLRPDAVAGMSPSDLFLRGFLAGQKATTRFDIAGAMDQLAKAQAETGTPYGAVLRKRPRAASARGYAIMEMSQFWAVAQRLAGRPEAGQ